MITPEPPAVWWSPTWRAVIEQFRDGHYEVLGEPAVPLAELPADAVRLVPVVERCDEVISGLFGQAIGPCIRTGEHKVHDDGRGQTWWTTKTDEAAAAVPDTGQAPESPTASTPKAGRWGSGEAETATDTVPAPDVAALLARCDAEDRSAGEFGWIQTTEIRRLLGTDTTPDRLAWIGTADETAAVERHARYQETACARRPAEEHPDA